MTRAPHSPESVLEIQKPCPKRWGELIGDEKRRFCSECSIHVHNATQLTREETRELIASAESRVCLRVEYDASGTPLFRERARDKAARAARWALSAAAGLLAACNGGLQSSAPESSGQLNGGAGPSPTGQAITTEKLGDFAVPQAPRIERLGEVATISEPAPLPPLDAPVRPGGM